MRVEKKFRANSNFWATNNKINLNELISFRYVQHWKRIPLSMNQELFENVKVNI